jgi:hypothetical protein
MPRDANGDMTLPSENPVTTDTVIDSTVHNATMEDIRAELEDSLSRSGKGGMLVPIPNPDGSVGGPGITFEDEMTSGLYRAGANDVRMSIGGSAVWRWVAGLTENITGILRSGVANGASAIAHLLNTNVAYTTAGAKLLSVQNNGAEKAAIDKDGTLTLATPLARLQLVAVGQQKSTYAAGAPYTTNSTTYVPVQDGSAHDVTVTITTSTAGRPVMLMAQPSGDNGGYFAVLSDAGAARTMTVGFYRDVGAAVVGSASMQAPASTAINYPGTFTYLDTSVSASTAYVYTLQFKVSNGAATGYVNKVELIAYEL